MIAALIYATLLLALSSVYGVYFIHQSHLCLNTQAHTPQKIYYFYNFQGLLQHLYH